MCNLLLSLPLVLSALHAAGGGGEAEGGETEVLCIFLRPGDCKPAALQSALTAGQAAVVAKHYLKDHATALTVRCGIFPTGKVLMS